MKKYDKLFKECGIILSETQLTMFQKYYQFLISENKKYNLTNIVDEQEVVVKHFIDSLYLLKYIGHSKSICDIGAGAGFPSIPIKIVFPQLHLTIIEPTQKRVHFLNKLIMMLDLENVNIVCDRAEIYGKIHREEFDIVTARAVSNLKILSELCIPLVKSGGCFIPLKGKDIEDEVNFAEDKITKMGCYLETIETYDLPMHYGTRNILVYKKNKVTPIEYPRNYNVIKKSKV